MIEVFYEQLNYEMLTESEAYGVCFALSYDQKNLKLIFEHGNSKPRVQVLRETC